ncbi:MAG: DUF4396 domain-containing protein [Rhodanobacter sp.]|nr:DUF4396 domain-containing protein [Rhodanobacter sp.]
MLLQPIDIFVYAWLAIAVLSAIYVAWDQFRGNPEPTVMKWGFVLITLYMGPIGLLLYVMADKEPTPGTHEAFVQPLWKQGAGSAVHCVAGDATGIILAAVVVSLIGLPMWADLIVEYAAGFLFGLLIFQSLFMRKMMGGSYLENVRKSFMPEFISMNAMMAGMAPVMVLLMMGRDMRAMWPGEPLFWFVMSLGVTAGYAVTYPVNVWLVSRGMKHGLMTVRDDAPPQHDERPQASTSASHDHGAMASMPADHVMSAVTGKDDGKHGMHDASSGHGMHGGGKTPTRAQLIAVTAFHQPDADRRHDATLRLRQHAVVRARGRQADHAAGHDHHPGNPGRDHARHGRYRSAYQRVHRTGRCPRRSTAAAADRRGGEGVSLQPRSDPVEHPRRSTGERLCGQSPGARPTHRAGARRSRALRGHQPSAGINHATLAWIDRAQRDGRPGHGHAEAYRARRHVHLRLCGATGRHLLLSLTRSSGSPAKPGPLRRTHRASHAQLGEPQAPRGAAPAAGRGNGGGRSGERSESRPRVHPPAAGMAGS